MKTFPLHRDLNITPQSRKSHLEVLRETMHDEEHYDRFNLMYQYLSIIDSKASSLLTYNSLLITGIAIILSIEDHVGNYLYPYLLAIAMFMTSSMFCLWVVFLHWSSTQDLQDAAKHLDELLEVREKRSVQYRRAWHFSFWTTGSLLLLILVNVLQLILHTP